MSEVMPRAERGRLWLWPGRALYVGQLEDTAAHRHHAVQVCVSLRGRFRLRAHAAAEWGQCGAAVVASDALHQLHGGSALLALLYLDPDEQQGRRLTMHAPEDGIVHVAPSVVDDVARRLLLVWERPDTPPGLETLMDALLARLTAASPPARDMDPRVAQALAFLRAAPNRRARAAEVAGVVGLSPSRLGHLFSAHVGLPLRRYLLWLRLQDAIQAAAGGVSLTDAAHAAGFADSAHLSRTFRDMFGMAPSDLLRGSQIVQVETAPA